MQEFQRLHLQVNYPAAIGEALGFAVPMRLLGGADQDDTPGWVKRAPDPGPKSDARSGHREITS